MADVYFYPYNTADIAGFTDKVLILNESSSNAQITESFTIPATLDYQGPKPLPGAALTITVGAVARTVVYNKFPSSGQVGVFTNDGRLRFHSSDSGGTAQVQMFPEVTSVNAALLEHLQSQLALAQTAVQPNDDPTFGDVTANLVDSASVLGNEMAIDGTSVVRFYPPNFGSNIGKSASDLGVTIQSTNGFVAIGMGPYLRAGSILSDIEVDYYGDQIGDTLAMILQSQDVASGSDPAGTRTTRVSGSVNPPSTGYYGTAAFTAGYTVLDKVHYMRLTGTYSAAAMQIFEIRLIFSKQVL